jgi:hypothetical protein
VCPDDAILVSPPLRGPRWVNADGCCVIIGPHRFAVLSINGRLRSAQHFAIDFLQLDQAGHGYEGDPHFVTNWVDYGSPIYSATAGGVIEARDGLTDEPPDSLPSDLPVGDL